MGRPNFFVRVAASLRAAADALSGRLIRPTRQDYSRRTQLSTVTASSITAALSSAAGGDLRALGSIYDLLPATDSHIRGVRRQLIAGVTSLPAEIVPVDDSSEAQRAADLCRAAVDRPDSGMRDAIIGIIEGDLRGASLTEILWNDPGSTPRRWIGFRVVPQQRLRYDMETGSVRVAVDPGDAKGVALADYPDKFLCTVVDRDVPDFSLRGVYRSILAEWFGRMNVGQWEMQSIERFGMPVPVGKYNRDEDRQVLESAFADFGSAGSLVVSEGTSVEFVSTSVPTSGALIHETFLEKSAQRISVAFLGSQQTATVGTDQGSKASAAVSQLVRKDVIWALWQLISETIRRDLLMSLVRLNLGESYVRYTPQYVPQFDDAVDMAATAAALLTITRDLGLSVGESYARELLSVPAPADGEDTVEPAPLANADPFGLGALPSPGVKVDAPLDPAVAPEADVQSLARNGAQMTSRHGLFQSVADGTLPAESVIQLIMLSIPTIDEAKARRLVAPAQNFTPETPSVPAAASARRRSQLAAETPEPPAKPPRDAGAEITDPIAALLEDLGDDGDLASFGMALDKLPEPAIPLLGDKLSAALADAYLGSKHEVRKAREARK
jgi:phage gp29-like protein